MTHTPTPWIHVTGNLIRDTHGNCISGDSSAIRSDGNAEFIVKACNAHDELVAALKDMTAILAKIQNTLTGYLMPDSTLDQDECINEILDITDHKNTLAKQRLALQALTKAEKGV